MNSIHLLSLACTLLSFGVVETHSAEKSALERDSKGWQDLTPDNKLTGWKRIPLGPKKKLVEKSPWVVKGNKLICNRPGVWEMLLMDKEFSDGIFHIEWRFKKVKGEPQYNSGVYVRTSGNGSIWHQVQVAHVDKAPRLADIFGDTLVEDTFKRVIVESEGHKRANPPGEWNTYEITCKGNTVSVWINGATTSTWKYCPLKKGHLGVQSEHFVIEFRNMKFKPLR